RHHLKPGSAWSDFDRLRVKIAGCQTVGKYQRTLSLAKLPKLPPVLIVQVKNCGARRVRPAAFEKHLLGAEVVFHCAVVIEMVAGEIGEDSHIKRNSENTLLFKRVR